MLNGSHDVFLQSSVPLGVSLILFAIHAPNFGGVNRRFQAKFAKHQNFHITETAASILTKFCTTMKTTK